MFVKEHTDICQVHCDIVLRTTYVTVPLVANKSEKVNEQNQIFFNKFAVLFLRA